MSSATTDSFESHPSSKYIREYSEIFLGNILSHSEYFYLMEVLLRLDTSQGLAEHLLLRLVHRLRKLVA